MDGSIRRFEGWCYEFVFTLRFALGRPHGVGRVSRLSAPAADDPGRFAAGKSDHLSAGPEAEGQRLLDEANAKLINAQTDADKQMAAFELQEAKEMAEALRQDAIKSANMRQKAYGFAASFFMIWVLVFGAINLMSSFGIVNYRMLITPVNKDLGDGIKMTIPFAAFPFIAIQSWADAPTATTLYQPGKAPQLTASDQVAVLALARMLRANEDGEQRLGNAQILIQRLALMLDGVPQRFISDRSRDDR